MAWANSLIPTGSIVRTLNATIAPNFGTNAFWIALYNNTVTPSQDTVAPGYNVAPWNTGEVTGTGWSAGGVALTGTTAVLTTGVGVTMTAAAVSQTGTTLTAINGCILYDNTLGNKDIFAAIYFGGAYSTSAGTFGITWATANSVANTVWYIQLH